MRTVAALGWAAACIASGREFPEPFDTERDTAAAPLPPDEAAAGMRTPAGLRVELFAAEPEIRNPIALAWDRRGRLWVAENFTYEGHPLRLESRLRDRVVVFEDPDGDGRPDRRRVFLDDLVRLTGLEVGLGGVWLMCPPRLLFVPDRDGDGLPDGPARTVLDGFDVAEQSHHTFANGLRFGPDGWLYGRAGGSSPGRVGPPGTPTDRRVRLEGGIWRYAPRRHASADPQGGRFEVLCHGTTNPWGHDWDAFGDCFFVNTVNGHLFHLVPGARHPRNGFLDPHPHVHETIPTHADHWHFDVGGGWQNSRDGAADDHGGGHAHSGAMIYLGDDWPAEYRGRLFTWNFHGRRANQEILERHGCGFRARHGPDLLHSRDMFFRGIDLAGGPDGSVLAIDWSDTGECHESTGVHRGSGRIFRISAADPRPGRQPPPALERMTATALAALVEHPNDWFPRQARLLLAERAAPAGVSETGAADGDLEAACGMLRRHVAGHDPVVASRAVFTLHAVGRCDEPLLRGLLTHPHERLRAQAVRLLGDDWPIDGVLAPAVVDDAEAARVTAAYARLAPDLLRTARDDESGLVRLALGSLLQRLPVAVRPDLAAALMARSEDADDHDLPLLVWFGLMPVVEADPFRAADLAVGSRWPRTARLIAGRLAGMIEDPPAAGGISGAGSPAAGDIYGAGSPAAGGVTGAGSPAAGGVLGAGSPAAGGVSRLVAGIATAVDAAAAEPLLAGMAAGLAGRRHAVPPSGWERVVARFEADPALGATVRDLSTLFGDGRALDEIRRLVLDSEADAALRRSALETLVARRDAGLRDICLPLLGDTRFELVAARGLAACDDPASARALVEAAGRFRGPRRSAVIGILATRPSFATALVAAVAAGSIPRDAVSAADLRLIHGLGVPELDAAVAREWGHVRAARTTAERRIRDLRVRLTPDVLAAADLDRGRVLFLERCGTCHLMWGEGRPIGPDLSGGNRTDLDALLENVVDPSAMVPRDFRMSVVTLADGRVLQGLLTSRHAATLTLVTPTDRHVLPLEEVADVVVTDESPMPEGLLDLLPSDGVRDLVGYLMQPGPLPPASGGGVVPQP